jgi:hypothetical protein
VRSDHEGKGLKYLSYSKEQHERYICTSADPKIEMEKTCSTKGPIKMDLDDTVWGPGLA